MTMTAISDALREQAAMIRRLEEENRRLREAVRLSAQTYAALQEVRNELSRIRKMAKAAGK
jgi:F0F1-type ATP synthase membrane subunit b/b'